MCQPHYLLSPMTEEHQDSRGLDLRDIGQTQPKQPTQRLYERSGRRHSASKGYTATTDSVPLVRETG